MSFLWDILEIDALTSCVNDEKKRKAVKVILYDEAYDKAFPPINSFSRKRYGKLSEKLIGNKPSRNFIKIGRLDG